jgi:hypothetical protein
MRRLLEDGRRASIYYKRNSGSVMSSLQRPLACNLCFRVLAAEETPAQDLHSTRKEF